MSDGVLMQEPATVTGDITTGTNATTETPMPICACGATERHAVDAHRCARGHALRGNQLHYQHGAYSYAHRGEASLPPELRVTVAEFKSQVISDRGGLDELSAIEAARIGHLAEVETTLRLLASDIARNGLLTKKGRTRTVFGRWLEALDRWEKLASHIGDGRRARTVPSLNDYLRAATPIAENEQ
jgi:hypothetical protein